MNQITGLIDGRKSDLTIFTILFFIMITMSKADKTFRYCNESMKFTLQNIASKDTYLIEINGIRFVVKSNPSMVTIVAKINGFFPYIVWCLKLCFLFNVNFIQRHVGPETSLKVLIGRWMVIQMIGVAQIPKKLIMII